MRLGNEAAVGLSDDGQWALLITSEGGRPGLTLTPIGVGSPMVVPVGTMDVRAGFHVEAKRVGFNTWPWRSYWAEPPSSQPRPITPEGVMAVPGLLKDDRILGWSPGDRSLALYPVHGGAAQPLAWHLGPESEWIWPIRVSNDGRFVFVNTGMMPARVDLVDIVTGRSTLWRTLGAEPRPGVSRIFGPLLTPNGTSYAYGYGEWLQDLYLVEDLRF